MANVKFGVVGCGRIGKLHINNLLNNIDGAEVVAAADPMLDKSGAREWLAERGITNVSTNYMDVVTNPDVDVVMVCSSTDTHCEVSMEAVKAGKDVFCEKPIDYDIEKIKKLLALVEEKGVKFQVGFNRRFDHNHKAVADAVKEGKIGDPHYINVTSRDPEPPPASYVAVSGGIFYDMMIHDFDMVRYLSGSEAVEISAVGSCLVNPNLQEESGIPDVDTAVVTMKMANGAIATINNSRQAVYGYDQRVEVFGSKGMAADQNDLNSTATITTVDGAVSEKPKWFFLERYNDAFIEQIKYFIDSIVNDTGYTEKSKSTLRIGVDVLPPIPRDTTDRNRTSPVAFTGNKFEFRMPGSSQSIAGPTTVLNTIIADSLCVFADELEKASDFTSALHELIKRTFKEHGRILFGGNGYDESWVAEAEKRGLKNLKNSSTALPEYMLPKNIELLTKYGVYTESEIIARNEIHMEHYCKVIAIEGETLVDMVQHGILNAVSEYTAALSETLIKKRKALPEVPCRVESALIGTLSSLNESLLDKMVSLKSALETAPSVGSAELMKYYHDEVFLKMEDMRAVIDKLETLTATEYWPYPSYYDMLFSV